MHVHLVVVTEEREADAVAGRVPGTGDGEAAAALAHGRHEILRQRPWRGLHSNHQGLERRLPLLRSNPGAA